MHLPQPLAPDRHIGHAGHPQQSWLDRPTGDQRQFRRLDLVRRNPDHHEAVGRRQGLENDRWVCHVRQGVGQRQAFLDHLPCFHDVRSPLKGEHDGRKTDHRLGSDRLEPRHPAQQLLEIEGDQALHLLRGQPDRFRLNLHDGRCEFREDVDGHLVELGGAEHDQCGGSTQHHEAELADSNQSSSETYLSDLLTEAEAPLVVQRSDPARAVNGWAAIS